ncbi:unnamed protein product [Rotaria socialis]|uniref:Uncharacterized protein n=1 Tax=Rotaria socialis TaxID=392032 RepID=A0A820X182_9BILA|nr:unnamed protein product [Rotaria socialis]CAF4525209.1 unnamed protein product [Rotaria socialis]
MSNNSGRKSEFIPAVYTRYFERSETPKSSRGHIYFNENHEESSKNYQIKRDLLFKRLFPSKYAESNVNNTDNENGTQNENNNSLNRTNESLGDFIPLSDSNSSTLKRKQPSPSLEANFNFSSSDENDEDSSREEQLPTSTHASIVGHVHPRATIENVRKVLIRELYQRTSDSHTEWLKCKMSLSKEYINPKYYADFQRRYQRDMNKHTPKRKKTSSISNKLENGYYVHDLTKNDESTATIQLNDTLDSDYIIETSPIKPVKKNSSSASIILINDSPVQSKCTPEFIILDSDDDDTDNNTHDRLSQDKNSTYFIDRSSISSGAMSQPKSTSHDDYHEEDSKYAQLPSRNTPSEPTIRPIISKHQRRKQNSSLNSTQPLVSAIDRIMDQIDQSNPLEDSKDFEKQNLLIKQNKKRKKKKKKRLNNTTSN